MLEILAGSLSALTPLTVTIDNHVFRLYYKFTTLILFTSAGILLTDQLFGAPIDCVIDSGIEKSEHYKKSVDTFCWVAATYTVNELNTQRQRTLFYEGVGQFDPTQNHTENRQVHYRWICFIFFIQGIFFYLPYYFWKSWEGGKMEGMSKHLDSPVEITLEKDRRTRRVELLLDNLEAFDLNSHEWYTYRLYACEVLNLVILVASFIFTHFLLNGQFGLVGFELLFSGQSKTLNKIFPLHSKCLWKTFGPSGSVQAHDALCVLPLNSFNRMAFGFLWFWYLLVGVITLGWLAFRAATIILIPLRSWILRWKAAPIVSTHQHHHRGSDDCIDFICQHFPHPDWFVLCQLTDNTDSIAILEIIEGLCERLKYKIPPRPETTGRRLTYPDIVFPDKQPANGK